MNVTGGSTDVSAYFQMRLLAGGDATGLTITDFDLTYTRSGATPAAKADASDLGSANAAHTDNGGYEVDPADAPGLHRFDFPDAAFAAGAREVILTVKHASCFTESLRVQIDAEVSVTEWNGVKLATTNPLPNAAPDAAGGLPTTTKITDARLGALTDWIDGGRLDLLLDAIKAATDNLPGDPADASDIATAFAAVPAAVWANGTRTLSSFGTLVADIADQVWEELLADHSGTAGSTAEALDGATAPTAAEVRAEMDANSTKLAAIKAKTDTIGSSSVTAVAPVADDGDITIEQGDDYNADDGRELSWTNDGDAWPDLTAATIVLKVEGSSTTYDAECTNPGETEQVVKVELTDTETDAMQLGARGYELEATLSSGNVVSLVRGTITVRKSY